MKVGDKYRMWYVGFREARRAGGERGEERGHRDTCYAESADGVRWERPELGIVEADGSKANNLVMEADTGWNLCPFIDGHPDPLYPERYKAVSRVRSTITVDDRPVLRGFLSDDGLNWRMLDKDPIIVATPGYNPKLDSPISSFWDAVRGHYVAYYRGMAPPGIRAIRRSISTDFRNWSTPEYVDLGDSPLEELYMSACTPYFRAPDIYLSFPNRFVRERTVMTGAVRAGIAETCFMASRDGVHFSRHFMEAFIRPGMDQRNWHKHAMMVGTGVHETSPGELSIYYVENHGHPTCRIRRGALRTDGFTSVSTGYSGGEMVTRPFTFEGDHLVINFSTSVVGAVRVELQDREGRPLEGFAMDDCEEIFGDQIGRVVRWKGGDNVGAFENQPVKLRFAMTKEADLYSIKFRKAAR